MKLIHTAKHTIRNFFIWFITVLGIVKLYRIRQAKHCPLVRIIIFHDVPHMRWFDIVIEEIKKSFHILTPDAFHRGEFHPEKINVLITFDDGYASWVTTALPILEENEVKALFFVSSGLLDIAESEEKAERFMRERFLITPREPLTWEGLKKIHEKGHTIGGHARTHANLAKVSDEILTAEVLDDKHALEEHLGTTIVDFAYPFGTQTHVNERAAECVRSLGYLHGYTAMSDFVEEHQSYMIPRMCIDETLYSGGIKRWIRGGFDIFEKVKNICAR